MFSMKIDGTFNLYFHFFFNGHYNDQKCYGHYVLNNTVAIGSEENSMNLLDILMCFMPIRILMGSLPLPYLFMVILI